MREWSGISLPGQLVSKPKEAPTDQQAQYDAAEKLLADGETAKAAIAFGKLGDYKDFEKILTGDYAVTDAKVKDYLLDYLRIQYFLRQEH